MAPVASLVQQIEQQSREAAAEAAPFLATIEAQDQAADRLLGRISDEIWNEVGRPASDPALTILFPGGIAYYAEGATEEQPDRMELLAQLLERGVHPKLAAKDGKAYAKEIREGAETLRAAIDKARSKVARAKLLERVGTALARAAQVELMNLKRRYKSESFSEAEIHGVIPDRSAPPAKKAVPPASPEVPSLAIPPPRPARRDLPAIHDTKLWAARTRGVDALAIGPRRDPALAVIPIFGHLLGGSAAA